MSSSHRRKAVKVHLQWDDGVVYQGEWKDDKMCGQGTYTTPGGVIFSGTFNENAFQDGTCEFKNDTGNYILTYKSGKIDKASIKYTDGSSYTGTCEPNELTGSGKMQFVNGDVYNGAFSKGNRNGQGVYSWTSGDKYDGEVERRPNEWFWNIYLLRWKLCKWDI